MVARTAAASGPRAQIQAHVSVGRHDGGDTGLAYQEPRRAWPRAALVRRGRRRQRRPACGGCAARPQQRRGLLVAARRLMRRASWCGARRRTCTRPSSTCCSRPGSRWRAIPAVALRGLSVLFGTAAAAGRLPAGPRGRTARDGRGRCAVAAALVALHPLQVQQGRNARMYALGVLLWGAHRVAPAPGAPRRRRPSLDQLRRARPGSSSTRTTTRSSRWRLRCWAPWSSGPGAARAARHAGSVRAGCSCLRRGAAASRCRGCRRSSAPGHGACRRSTGSRRSCGRRAGLDALCAGRRGSRLRRGRVGRGSSLVLRRPSVGGPGAPRRAGRSSSWCRRCFPGCWPWRSPALGGRPLFLERFTVFAQVGLGALRRGLEPAARARRRWRRGRSPASVICGPASASCVSCQRSAGGGPGGALSAPRPPQPGDVAVSTRRAP